jgi:AraC family transcriptional regulator
MHQSERGILVVVKLLPGSYFGRTQSARSFAGITVLESVYGTDQAVPAHAHAAAFFDLILEGSCSEALAGRTRERARSTLAFHPAGEVHASRWHGPMPRCFHLELSAALLECARQYAPLVDQPRCFGEGGPRLLAQRLYSEFRRMDDLAPLVMEGLTLELLAETVRWTSRIPERKPPPWLRTVCDLLGARFAERLTLDEIAAVPGVHPAHLARVFRQVLGCTVGDYVRRLRIDFACRLLTRSDTPLVEIALAAGFVDQSHFSRTFRRQTGKSPAEFKKGHAARKGHT